MTRKILYFAKFTDSNGNHHFAIHSYDTLNGFVSSIRDYKFEDATYPCTDILDEHYGNSERYAIDDDFNVLDTWKDQIIGSFKFKRDALEFAKQKNDDQRYL